MSKDDDQTYEVGYKKPPKAHQFKKGQVSNPKGRPKGSQSFKTLFRKEMNEKITVNTAEGQKKITVMEAILKRLVEKGLKGDQKAIEKLLEHELRFNPENLAPDFNPDAPRTGVLAISASMTSEEFEEYAKTVKIPKEAQAYEER